MTNGNPPERIFLAVVLGGFGLVLISYPSIFHAPLIILSRGWLAAYESVEPLLLAWALGVLMGIVAKSFHHNYGGERP